MRAQLLDIQEGSGPGRGDGKHPSPGEGHRGPREAEEKGEGLGTRGWGVEQGCWSSPSAKPLPKRPPRGS